MAVSRSARAARSITGALRRGAHGGSLRRRLHHERRSGDDGPRGAARVEGRSRQLQRRALDGLSSSPRSPATPTWASARSAATRRTTRAALFVDERATPAQREALVAMARQLSNGVVGTVVQLTPTPIQFVDEGQAIRVSAELAPPDRRQGTEARPDLRRQAVVPPAVDGRRTPRWARRRERVQRRGARHQVERSEQALGVLRDVRLLELERSFIRERAPFWSDSVFADYGDPPSLERRSGLRRSIDLRLTSYPGSLIPVRSSLDPDIAHSMTATSAALLRPGATGGR